jgi:hypothetical protein
MKMMIVVRYGASDSVRLYTTMQEKYPATLKGGKAKDFDVEQSWVTLENGTFYIVVDAKDSLHVYDLCWEIRHAGEGVTVQVFPVMPSEAIRKLE